MASSCSPARGAATSGYAESPAALLALQRVQMIRFVTFDALFTLITLRKPIYVQYSEAFSPYLGTLPPDEIARSFKLGVLFLP
jgi:hypothetical protein